MSSHPVLRVEIENIGPIRSGAFELRPLTLFIGPSNTGKSYAAALAHSLINALAVLRQVQEDKTPGKRLTLALHAEEAVSGMLRVCFGCENHADLIARFASGEGARVRLKRLDPEGGERIILSVGISVGGGDSRGSPSESELEEEGDGVWEELVQAMEHLPKRSLYLPAARAGVLQSWSIMAAARPPLPLGPIGEFLESLIHAARMSRRRSRPIGSSPFRGALEMLEGNLLGGEVDFLHLPERSIPEVVYRARAGEEELAIPVWQVSATVMELASLILWIKHLLEPGEMLVIEEPEAHLHPENQRRVARALVRLVRAGVTVLCTTHSPLILHQVSNHILASRADPSRRKELGFTEEDLLREEEVGAYQFQMREDGRGSEIQPLPIVPGFGILEDEFVRVYEAIGEETYHLAGPLTIELGETPS